MTYVEFNDRVLFFYLNRSQTSNFTLCIDRHEVEGLISLNDIKGLSELHSDWDNLLKPARHSSTPAFLGLLAVQCLAASLMEAGENETAAAYRARLRDILGLSSAAQLGRLFTGHQKYEALHVQDLLWLEAVGYFDVSHGLKLRIPEIGQGGPWRHVKYPMSQALLNTEDIKYFSVFFHESFKPHELIPFRLFEETFWKNVGNVKMTRRAEVLLHNESKKTMCVQQLFNAYNHWEGGLYELPEDAKPAKARSYVPQADMAARVILNTEEQIPYFFLSNAPSVPLRAKDIFNLEHYRFFHRKADLLIFNQVDYADIEFEDSRFLYRNTPAYLLIRNRQGHRIADYLLRYGFAHQTIDDDITLFRFQEIKPGQYDPLLRFTMDSLPITLVGGIKNGRFRTYLKNWGPTIQSNLPYSVMLNASKIPYDPSGVQPGHYKIRMENYPDINFLVEDKVCTLPSLVPQRSGWNLHSLTTSEVYHLQGCYFHAGSDLRQPIHNQWLKMQRPLQSSPRVRHPVSKNNLIQLLKPIRP